MGVYYNAPPPTAKRRSAWTRVGGTTKAPTLVARRNGVTRRPTTALAGYDAPDLGSWFSNVVKAVTKGAGDVAAQAKRSAGDVTKLAPVLAPVLAATGIGIPFAGAIAAGASLVNRVRDSKVVQAAAQSQAAFRQLSAGANMSEQTPLTNALVNMIPGARDNPFLKDVNSTVATVKDTAAQVKRQTDRANAAAKAAAAARAAGDAAAAAAATAAQASAVQAAKDAATAAARTTAKAKKQAAKILADAKAAADKAAADRAAAVKEEAAAKAAGDLAAAAKAKAKQGRAIQAANKAKADAEAATAAAAAAVNAAQSNAVTGPVYNGPAPSSFVAPQADVPTGAAPAGIMEQIKANPIPALGIAGLAFLALRGKGGHRSWN